MSEKTANLLDFLRIPHRQAPSMFEAVAKEAADQYLKHDVAPDSAIAKIATSRGFNSDQVHRIVELANHQINSTLSKEAEDQLFTFPVATVKGVYDAMNGNEVVEDEVEKAAALIDWGVYDQLDDIPDYTQVLASRRFRQKMASAPEVEKVAEVKPAPRGNELDWLEKKAGADFEYARADLEVEISGLRKEWDKLGSDEERGEFLSATSCLLGHRGMSQLAARFGEGAVKIAGDLDPDEIEKIAEYLDKDHAVVVAVDRVRTKLAALGSAAEKAQEVLLLRGQQKSAERQEKWSRMFPKREQRMPLVLDAFRS